MKNSSGEIIAKRMLRKYRIGYFPEFRPLPNKKYRLDFLCNIGTRYFAIEIDGEHHYTLKGIFYDLKRDYLIRKLLKVKIYRVGYTNLEKELFKIIMYEKILYHINLIVWLSIAMFIGFYLFINYF